MQPDIRHLTIIIPPVTPDIHGGTYIAAYRALKGEITPEEARRLIEEARIRRGLRRASQRRA